MEKGPDGVAKLEFELPPKEIMSKLLDNIEAQLPREDHVKYDSRAKKLFGKKYVSMVIIRSNVKSYGTMFKIEFEDFVSWPS